MADMFNWLPVRDIISIILFAVSLVFLVNIELKRKTGKLDIWVLGTSLWLVGMIFDALKRVDGWAVLRMVEHLFQLAGSVTIAYAAYQTHKRMRSNVLLVKGQLEAV